MLKARQFSIGLFFFIAGGCWLLSAPTLAHDVPSQVTLYTFVKPTGQQLEVALRIPMDALGEISFPQRGPGYLNFAEADIAIDDAISVYILDNLNFFEEDRLLDKPQVVKRRVSLPSNRDFSDIEAALAHIDSPPLNDAVNLVWSQGFLDVHLRYSINSAESRFYLQSMLGNMGETTTTILRFSLPNGDERAFNFNGNPGRIELDPSPWQALMRFVRLGFGHILSGFDHLLFLFCLIIPVRQLNQLLIPVTAFTLAHSITLISSALGLLPTTIWFIPLIEALIALSVLYLACENIIGAKLQQRWWLTFAFGLIHGFGFSFILADSLQFAGSHLLSALLAFNIGVELGQIFVLLIFIPLLYVFFKFAPIKTGIILLSAFAAHSAWHWSMERINVLQQYRFGPLEFGPAFFSQLISWLILLVIAGAGVWAMWLWGEADKKAQPLIDND